MFTNDELDMIRKIVGKLNKQPTDQTNRFLESVGMQVSIMSGPLDIIEGKIVNRLNRLKRDSQ